MLSTRTYLYDIRDRSLAFFRIYRLSVYFVFVILLYAFWYPLPIEPNSAVDPRLVVGVVFTLGIIWIFLFNKLYDEAEDAVSQPEEMVPAHHRVFMRYLLWFLFLSPVLILIAFKMPLWPYILYVLSGFLYSFPVYKGLRGKNIFFVKNAMATFNSFAPVCFGMFVYFKPFYDTDFTPAIPALIALAGLHFVAEMLWDIRDTPGDKATGIMTLPVVMGIFYTKLLALGIVAFGALLLHENLSTIAVAAILCIFIFYATPERSPWFFHLLLVFIGFAILLLAFL